MKNGSKVWLVRLAADMTYYAGFGVVKGQVRDSDERPLTGSNKLKESWYIEVPEPRLESGKTVIDFPAAEIYKSEVDALLAAMKKNQAGIQRYWEANRKEIERLAQIKGNK